MKLAGSILVFLAVLAAAFAGGYAWHGDRDAAKVTAAAATAAVCETNLAAEQAALATVRERLADLDQRHRAAMADAERALDVRDDEIKRLSEIAVARTLSLRKNAHEDPDCNALAGLAVCASVARELWADPPQAAGADRPH